MPLLTPQLRRNLVLSHLDSATEELGIVCAAPRRENHHSQVEARHSAEDVQEVLGSLPKRANKGRGPTAKLGRQNTIKRISRKVEGNCSLSLAAAIFVYAVFYNSAI